MALRPGNPRRATRGTPIPGPGTAIPGPGRIGKRDSLPDSRPNRESGERKLGTSGSGRHSPSAGLSSWQCKKEGGRRPECNIQPRIVAAALAPAGYPRFPDLRPIGKRAISPFPIPSRKSGIPSPFPGQIGNRGNGNCGFPGLMALQGQPQAEESPLAGPGQVLKGTEGPSRVPVSSCGVFPFESSSSPHRSARVPGVILAPLCQRHRTCNRRLLRTRPCAT